MNATKLIEEAAEEICNEYCKWPEKYLEQGTLNEALYEEKCESCPLNKLL